MQRSLGGGGWGGKATRERKTILIPKIKDCDLCVSPQPHTSSLQEHFLYEKITGNPFLLSEWLSVELDLLSLYIFISLSLPPSLFFTERFSTFEQILLLPTVGDSNNL